MLQMCGGGSKSWVRVEVRKDIFVVVVVDNLGCEDLMEV